ncbi:hypothetical protein MVEN_00684900 [Mycena venus]|uniref:Uncharacterized protein n=1 Tax=Mycena venus TaxID=2733690 RepID=A0A8H6YJ13_9AGAR|nr:hypothetical protein MVEN_00684900 [Mycena venus]
MGIGYTTAQFGPSEHVETEPAPDFQSVPAGEDFCRPSARISLWSPHAAVVFKSSQDRYHRVATGKHRVGRRLQQGRTYLDGRCSAIRCCRSGAEPFGWTDSWSEHATAWGEGSGTETRAIF